MLAPGLLIAIVAGLIVFGIGQAASIIMEKVYIGDMDSSELDWINAIVESSMGNVIRKVTETISMNHGEYNVKDIIKALVSE